MKKPAFSLISHDGKDISCYYDIMKLLVPDINGWVIRPHMVKKKLVIDYIAPEKEAKVRKNFTFPEDLYSDKEKKLMEDM